jgi:hypothetical protein
MENIFYVPYPFSIGHTVSEISGQKNYYVHTSKLAYSASNHDHLNIITVIKMVFLKLEYRDSKFFAVVVLMCHSIIIQLWSIDKNLYMFDFHSMCAISMNRKVTKCIDYYFSIGLNCLLHGNMSTCKPRVNTLILNFSQQWLWSVLSSGMYDMWCSRNSPSTFLYCI